MLLLVRVWGAACTCVHMHLSDTLLRCTRGSQCLLRRWAEPPSSLAAPGSVPSTSTACWAPAAMHHSCMFVWCACFHHYTCMRCCSHASPQDNDTFLLLSSPLCPWQCRAATRLQAPVSHRVHKQPRKDAGRAGVAAEGLEGSRCRHQFGLSGPAVMATHIPFAGRAKHHQRLPRDPRSPWQGERISTGRGGVDRLSQRGLR